MAKCHACQGKHPGQSCIEHLNQRLTALEDDILASYKQPGYSHLSSIGRMAYGMTQRRLASERNTIPVAGRQDQAGLDVRSEAGEKDSA